MKCVKGNGFKYLKEEAGLVGDITHIESVLNDCINQMGEEYPQNKQKYAGARNLLIKAVESYRECKTKSASLWAIEYAMLSKVSKPGILLPEQMDAINSACGLKLVSDDVQTFVTKRMGKIEEGIKRITPTLTDIEKGNFIEDGKIFKQLEIRCNGAVDKETRKTFDEERDKYLKALPENVDIGSVIEIYNIVNEKYGELETKYEYTKEDDTTRY